MNKNEQRESLVQRLMSAAERRARQPERSEAVFEVGTGWLTSEHQARGTLLYAAPIRFPENWGDENMDAAPEGEMLRLYVQFEEHPTDDVPGGACAATIGFKDSEGWHFAGWCWSHDHFTDGKGKPVAWLPMLSAHPPAADARVAERCKCCGYLVTESEHRGCLRSAIDGDVFAKLRRAAVALHALTDRNISYVSNDAIFPFESHTQAYNHLIDARRHAKEAMAALAAEKGEK